MSWLNLFGKRSAAPSTAMEAPGFYGKAPALGDFISRRMPAAFSKQWDPWLQSLIEASRARLGEAWMDAWLEMPVWHFGLGSGIFGSGRAFGVLIPSVDRVGRQFPFTIVGAERASGSALSEWALQIEAEALAALDDDFAPKTLDGILTQLGGPGVPVVPRTTPITHSVASIEAAAWPEGVDNAAESLGPGETMWWCRGSERVAPTMLRVLGLPSLRYAGCFVMGDFPA